MLHIKLAICPNSQRYTTNFNEGRCSTRILRGEGLGPQRKSLTLNKIARNGNDNSKSVKGVYKAWEWHS